MNKSQFNPKLSYFGVISLFLVIAHTLNPWNIDRASWLDPSCIIECVVLTLFGLLTPWFNHRSSKMIYSPYTVCVTEHEKKQLQLQASVLL